jgi:hypothetical protein
MEEIGEEVECLSDQDCEINKKNQFFEKIFRRFSGFYNKVVGPVGIFGGLAGLLCFREFLAVLSIACLVFVIWEVFFWGINEIFHLKIEELKGFYHIFSDLGKVEEFCEVLDTVSEKVSENIRKKIVFGYLNSSQRLERTLRLIDLYSKSQAFVSFSGFFRRFQLFWVFLQVFTEIENILININVQKLDKTRKNLKIIDQKLRIQKQILQDLKVFETLENDEKLLRLSGVSLLVNSILDQEKKPPSFKPCSKKSITTNLSSPPEEIPETPKDPSDIFFIIEGLGEKDSNSSKPFSIPSHQNKISLPLIKELQSRFQKTAK